MLNNEQLIQLTSLSNTVVNKTCLFHTLKWMRTELTQKKKVRHSATGQLTLTKKQTLTYFENFDLGPIC